MAALRTFRRIFALPCRCIAAVLVASTALYSLQGCRPGPELNFWVDSLRDAEQRQHTAYSAPVSTRDSMRAADVLLDAFQDPDPAVRQHAAATIGEMRLSPTRTAPALIESLADPSPDVRAHAVVALGKLGMDAVQDLLLTLVERRALGTAPPGSTEDPADRDALAPGPSFCSALDEPPALAAIALGLVGTTAVDPIMQIVPLLDDHRRRLAAFAISRRGPGSARMLVRYLEERHAPMRETAALAIAALGPGAAHAADEIAPALARLVTDDDAAVRAAAAEALAAMAPGLSDGGSEDLPLHLAAGLDILQTAEAQQNILTALAALRTDADAARATVLPFAASTNAETARAALAALAAMGRGGSHMTGVFLAALRAGSDPRIAARGLARQGSEGVSILLDMGLDPSRPDSLRSAALQGLHDAAAADAEVREELRAAAPMVARLIGHGSPAVRAAGARLIAVAGGEIALDALVEALSDPDATVRKAAAEGFGHVGPEATHPLLRLAAQSAHPDTRAAALRALGQAANGERGIIDVLSAALDDPKLPIRIAAIDALEAIGPAARPTAPALLERLRNAAPFEATAIQNTLAALLPLDDDALPALRGMLAEGLHQSFVLELLIAMGPAAKAAVAELQVALSRPQLAPLAARALLATRLDLPLDPKILKILYDTSVEDFMAESRERLEGFLRCPASEWMTATAHVENRDVLRLPAPSSSEAIPADKVGTESTSLQDVHIILNGALRKAGYEANGTYDVPGGFALLTLIQRIGEAGSDLEDHDVRGQSEREWMSGSIEPRSAGELTGRLFLFPPGHSRFLVVAVTTQPELFVEDYSLSTRRPDLVEQTLGQRSVLVMVYDLERRPGQAAALLKSSAAPPHSLDLAGVLGE